MKNTRKFKLIKEYPGSPELGFITDETMYSSASYPEFWEEIEEPLFTTEDGVSIYENDIVRWCMDFKWLYKSKFVKEHLILDFKNDYKIFSTKKAAKKWIHLNQPKYSLQDLFNAKSDRSKFSTHFAIDFSKLPK